MTATLAGETSGPGFFEITRDAVRFLDRIKARDGGPAALSQAHLGLARHPGKCRRRMCAPISSPRSRGLRRRMPAGFTTSRDRTTCRRTSNPCSMACAACPRRWRANGARHLAGHLCRRASRAAASPRGCSAVSWRMRGDLSAAVDRATGSAVTFTERPVFWHACLPRATGVFPLSETPSHHLLIADDHPLFRGALREAVNGVFGRAEIAEAGTFEEVSEFLDRGIAEIDLILLDLQHAGRARLFRAYVSARAISQPADRGGVGQRRSGGNPSLHGVRRFRFHPQDARCRGVARGGGARAAG